MLVLGLMLLRPSLCRSFLISDCDGILTMDGWMDGRLRFSCFEKQNKKEKPFAVFYHVLFYSFQFNSLVSFIDLLKMHQIAQFQFPPLISFLDLFRRHFAIQSQSAL